MQSSIVYRKGISKVSPHASFIFSLFLFFVSLLDVISMRKIFVPIFLVLVSIPVMAQDNVWDALRPMTGFASEIDLPVKIVVFLLSLSIFIISLLAYNKSKSKRILLVSLAFALFALKWLVKILDIVYSPGEFLSDSSENIFELGILLSLLVALFYKKSWNKFFSNGKN